MKSNLVLAFLLAYLSKFFACGESALEEKAIARSASLFKNGMILRDLKAKKKKRKKGKKNAKKEKWNSMIIYPTMRPAVGGVMLGEGDDIEGSDDGAPNAPHYAGSLSRTRRPSSRPSISPSDKPSVPPSISPSANPTLSHAPSQSVQPSDNPTVSFNPTMSPKPSARYEVFIELC